MSSPSLSSLVALSALAALAGCEKDCTDIGCVDGVAVTFEPPLLRGAYQFDVEADDERYLCSESQILDGECAPLSLIATSGGFSELIIASHPTSVRIEVKASSEDAPVAVADVSPTYEQVNPNGDGCPPHCSSARVKATP